MIIASPSLCILLQVIIIINFIIISKLLYILHYYHIISSSIKLHRVKTIVLILDFESINIPLESDII